ncbi:MAG: folate-binding protein YgfZ [Proteobacteria bacterium]|nr:folate-binding protein YgfZ [Pseudomonadota bacterium]
MTKMIAHLSHRGIVEIQGDDKGTFLQGLISNDIKEVTPNHAIYAVLLTPQGRFLYDFFISEKDGSYFLEAEAARLEDLLKKLNLYKLRSQVILKIRPDLKVSALWGEGVASSLGLKEESGNARESVFMDPRLVELGARALGEIDQQSFQVMSVKDYAHHRLTLGVPEGGQDLIPEKSIPLESGLDELHAISWTKGCYMGQELTARTKYRGLVRKRLFPVTIEGDAPLFGTDILKNDTSVGEMRSHSGTQGLALLRVEALKDPGDFRSETSVLKPYIPFWMRVEDPV